MKGFPELQFIEKVTNRLRRLGVEFERHVLCEVEHKGIKYPIHGFVIGPKDPSVPTLGLFGGVHGLEKIGTHLILNYISSMAFRHSVGQHFKRKFKHVRLVSIPMINPVGVRFNKRGNGNGVDLMRNGPTTAEGSALPLASGHRVSSKIWWYRGKEGVLEKESQTLINFVKEHLFPSSFSISLDVHSGFGSKDRLWYPYGKSNEAFPKISEVRDLRRTMKLVNPFHVYQMEQQSDSYLIHGDLWDHLFDLHHQNKNSSGSYLPFTLEMGSWNWVRKNPLQAFTSMGLFHPIKPHRIKRTMRRHWWLLDFLSSFVAHESRKDLSEEEKIQLIS